MGVGLVRSLQLPDILWIHWRVYNSIANTSKEVLFLPPSDAYVRRFLYLVYTLLTLLHESSERSSFISGPGLNSSPLEAKNPGVFLRFSKNLSLPALTPCKSAFCLYAFASSGYFTCVKSHTRCLLRLASFT